MTLVPPAAVNAFGRHGFAFSFWPGFTDPDGSGDIAQSLLAPSGGPLLLETASDDLAVGAPVGGAVLAFTRAGARDSSYGSGGKALAIGDGLTDGGDGGGAVLGPAGTVVMDGLSGTADDGDGGGEIDIVRLLADGHLDRSFGTAGKVVLAISDASVFAPVVSADGSVILAYQTAGAPQLVRLSSAGAIDSTFTPRLPSGATIDDIAVGRDGDVLVLLTARRRAKVLAVTPAGGLDAHFGTAGAAIVPGTPGAVSSLDVDSDGTLLVTGSKGHDWLLARLTASGGVDRRYGATARGVTERPDPFAAHGSAMATTALGLPDGDVLVGGAADSIARAGFPGDAFGDGFLAELGVSGAPIRSFGTKAALKLFPEGPLGNFATASVRALTLGGDHAVYVAGTTSTLPDPECAESCVSTMAWLTSVTAH